MAVKTLSFFIIICFKNMDKKLNITTYIENLFNRISTFSKAVYIIFLPLLIKTILT
jgi:hypothetical protein